MRGTAVLLLATGACTRIVAPDLPEGPERLVVEARLERRQDDTAGRQEIRLTITDRFDGEGPPPPASGAVVRVADDAGGEWIFTAPPGAPGVYVAAGLVPAAGRSYTLTIDYQGERYQASHSLVPVAPIDSIYFVFRDAGLAEGDSGLRATIDYTDPAGIRNFYLWELLVDGILRLDPDPGNRFTAISDDRFFDGGRVVGYQPNHHEVVEPGQVVAMRQIGLSEPAYRYYFALFEQTGGRGGPFSVPPASVRGNVANRTAPAHYPLGFFSVAEVAEKTAAVPPVPGSLLEFRPSAARGLRAGSPGPALPEGIRELP